MRIASLEAYGVPPQLLAVWEDTLSSELLPIQERAVVEGQVLAGGSQLVQAPTSAGKTFIGEMAATRAALAGRKVLYLVPTKALAEDKYAHFSRLYGPLGLSIIACTRDRRGDDARFCRGDFDVAVTIPEKVRALWARSGTSQFLGLCVIDELQVLSDPGRGPCLELLLAQLRRLPRLQVIGLSACLGASPRLAEYLRARWLQTSERPLELRQGVLVGGCFHYRTPAGEEAQEPLEGGLEEGDTYAEAARRLAVAFARRGEPTIVFTRDRAGALGLAAAVAETLASGPRALQASGAVPLPLAFDPSCLEPTAVRGQLRALLPHGVAFHSADLQFEDRRQVEQMFRAGDLLVVCATPTLALGVNLPARNVIIDPQGWQSEAAGAPTTLCPIGRGDYENRAGRAGRLGWGGFGRAILLADSELSRAALAARYLTADFTVPEPALGSLPPLQTVLHVAGAAAATRQTLEETYLQTYTAYLRGHTALPAALDEAAERCLQRQALRQTAEGGLTPTVLGGIAAAAGVGFGTFAWLQHWVARAGRPPTNLEASLLAALCDEAGEAATWGPRARSLDYCQALRDLAGENGEAGDLLEALLATGERDRRRRDLAARQVLALYRWLGDEDTAEVEAAVYLSAARLAALGETAGWIVETLAELGAEQGWPLAACKRLQTHAESLALGVSAPLLPLGRLRVFGLGRDHLHRLARAGLQSPRDVLEAGPEYLQAHLPAPLADALLRAVEGRLRRAPRAADLRFGPEHRVAPGVRPCVEDAATCVEDAATCVEDAATCVEDAATCVEDAATCVEGAAPDTEGATLDLQSPIETTANDDGAEPEGGHTAPAAAAAPAPPAAEAEATALVIDAGTPGQVVVYGRRLTVRPAEFRLLQILAETPGRGVPYDTLYTRMWDGDRLVEPGQIYSHRSRLAAKLRELLPGLDVNGFLVTIRCYGLMLNLRRDQVLVG